MSEKISLRPMFKRVIVEVDEVNPHQKEKTESGIYLPNSKVIMQTMDKEADGIVAGGVQRIKYGVIQAVAEDCVSKIKVGDAVVVDSFAGMPVAMGIPNLIIIPEGAIQYIIDVSND